MNGTWLAMAWAVEDGNKEALAKLEQLIRNWPFDFKQYAKATPNGEAAIFRDMVNFLAQAEKHREYVGLDCSNMMQIFSGATAVA